MLRIACHRRQILLNRGHPWVDVLAEDVMFVSRSHLGERHIRLNHIVDHFDLRATRLEGVFEWTIAVRLWDQHTELVDLISRACRIRLLHR